MSLLLLSINKTTSINFENFFNSLREGEIITSPVIPPETNTQESQIKKRGRGRPVLTDAEKAANKAQREANKLDGSANKNLVFLFFKLDYQY